MRIAVVSPFLDRRHGTELCLSEQVERLAGQHGCDIHLYCQRVEDLAGPAAGAGAARIWWHRVSEIRGPHLIKFLWWFFANQRLRAKDRADIDLRPDITYSPGINCLDADAIIVHIVFHDFYARLHSGLQLRKLPVASWPRALHRKVYYRLIMALERHIYRDPAIHLAAVSKLVADQLKSHFGRQDVVVIPNAVDTARFNVQARALQRNAARSRLGIAGSEFVILLIGNDWKKKGLDQLMKASSLLRELPIFLLVVGNDDVRPYSKLLRELDLQDRVRFHPPQKDVVAFYAAADVYTGPSVEDAFGLPILEAMACGLPVIASVRAGASAAVEDGLNGLLLRRPEDCEELSRHLRLLLLNPALREAMGAAAARSTADMDWDTNASTTFAFLASISRARAKYQT